MIKKITIFAALLIVVGVIGSIFTLKPTLKSKAISEEKIIDEKFTRLNVITDNSIIEVLPTKESKAKIELNGKTQGNANYDISTEVNDSTLTVIVKNKKRSLINFYTSMLTLKVSIPEQLYESMYVEGGNGRISVKNLEANDIHMKTDNGKIDLNNMNGTTIKTEADNGTISIQDAKASSITATTDNGKIILNNAIANIEGKANNGAITIENPQIDYPINLETDNGKILIRTDEEPKNASIHVDVDNGHVEIFNTSNRNVTFGNGKNIISLKTDNGSVIIERK